MSASAAVMNLPSEDVLPEIDRTFSFEWFSSLPDYREANLAQLEQFLSELHLPTPWQGIDVACGVGLMSELCHEIAGKIGAMIQRTVCVDLDRQALEIAREKLARYPASFLQCVGARLPLRDGTGSFLVIGNGIHNFAAQDKVALFRDAFRVLRGGASMFFNSAFYEGSVVDGTERFYRENMSRALRQILRLMPRPAEIGGEKPEAAKMISADEYVALAHDAGFSEVETHEMTVNMDQEMWEAICEYRGYSMGAFHDRYPAEVACPAMRQAVRDIFQDPEWEKKYPGMEEGGKRFIPRRWLWVTARKP
jgi:ubiquinone/menaquinone biosynthesis C-methylase UbiE